MVAKGLRRTEGTLAQARRRDRGEPRQGIASAAALAVVVAAWCLLLGGPTHAQEPLPEVTIAAEADVDESENAVFTLTRTGALEEALTVQVAVSQEWTGSEVGEPRRLQEPLPSAATFQAGASHATLSLPSRDDQLHQSDVVVAVEIVTGEGYTLGSPSRDSLVVREDDTLTMQMFIVANKEMAEGQLLPVRVSALSNGFGGQVEFRLSLENGTAKLGADYSGIGFPTTQFFRLQKTSILLATVVVTAQADGTSLFGGNLAQTILFSREDDKLEIDETMTIRLEILSTTNEIVAQGSTKTITIKDKKPLVTITPSAGLFSEGENATFTLSRTGSTDDELTVDVSIRETGDTLPRALPRTATFAAGSPSATLTLATLSDSSHEPDSKVTVAIERDADVPAAYRATAPDSTTVIVADDDGDARAVKIAPLTLNVTEDNTTTYSVRLATEPTSEVTITPTSGDDRAASVAPTVIRFTHTNWTTPQSFTVTGKRDADTDDETVTITHAVTGADYGENAVIAPHVTVGITDHVSDYSGKPGVRIIPTTIEVDEGGTAEYAVVLAAQPTGTVLIGVTKDSLNYKTDANPQSVRFTVENWDIPQMITVSAFEDDDARDERTEFYHSSQSGDYAGVSIPIVVARVRDDDGEGAKPTVSGHLGTAVREGEAVTLSLRRTGSTAAELEVTVSVSETGEFIDAGDEGERTITFAPGARIATLSIETADNTFGEPDGTVTARIVADNDYRVGNPASMDATVMDDEGLSSEVRLAVDTQSVTESGAPTTVNVTASLDRGPRREPTAIEVTVGAAHDSATSGVDYRTVEDLNMTIRSGATSATGSFTLAPTNDTQGEGDERISLTGSAGELTLTGTQVTIVDDEPPSEVALEVSPASIGENAGATRVEVTARLKGTVRPDATIVTVVVGHADDDATQGTDYQMVDDLTLTIPAQSMRATSRFTLTPTNDNIREGPETVSVTGSATGLTVTGTHIAITDDEEAAGGAPTITAPNAFRVPATLGVDLSSITDPNGVTSIADNARYRWMRLSSNGRRFETELGTEATYTLTDAERGKKIRVEVTFNDDAGFEETVTSATFPAGRTIEPASVCLAPTYVGGASQRWTGKVGIKKDTSATTAFGFFGAGSGSLPGNTFNTGDSSYAIESSAVDTNQQLTLSLDKDLSAEEKRTFVLHVCNEAFPFGAATLHDNHVYTWDSTGLDWSTQAERTLWLSRDNAPPTVSAVSVDATSVVVAFNEDLDAAPNLTNSVFTVRRMTEPDMTETVTLVGTPWINRRTVTLTLSEPVAATDIGVEITYTKPEVGTDNTLADKLGNEVADFTREMISNTSNTAPTASNSTVGATEDTDYTFSAADFNFADEDAGARLESVTIETLPTLGTGTLKLADSNMRAGASVTRAQIDNGRLTYSPSENGHGAAHASFSFRVSDGRDESADAYTMTIDVEVTNDLATGAPLVTALIVFRVPATLSVDLSAIEDIEGVTRIAESAAYRWKRFDSGGTIVAPDIATGPTYTLAAADVGMRIGVEVTFNDDAGFEESITSAAFPTTGTIRSAGTCPAPTHAGGETRIWSANVGLLEVSAGGFEIYGFFGPGAGSLDNTALNTGTGNYTVQRFSVGENGAVAIKLDKALAADEKRTLIAHVCDRALLFKTAGLSSNIYQWSSTGLDWSDHAQRAVYVSRDTVAPTLSHISVAGTSVVLTFSETLSAASGLANSAFTVMKTVQSVEETLTLSAAPVISGAAVTLTLSAAVESIDTVAVRYDKPDSGSNNKLADRTDNEVEDFTTEADAPPHVVSIARQTPSASPINASSLTWRVTFSKDVANVDATDFAGERHDGDADGRQRGDGIDGL